MKQFYLLLCFMSFMMASAQEMASSKGDAAIEFKLHPNPVYDGVVFVQSNKPSPKTIRIYDLFGKVVLEKRIVTDKLLLGTLVPGVYMVQLQQEGALATKKLVIR